MNIYLWKEDIEDGESVMTAEYRPVEYGKDYDVVNNPDSLRQVTRYINEYSQHIWDNELTGDKEFVRGGFARRKRA